ncbi:PH domain-containing protein [Clostridium sp. MB40-C1]|uniref:PH domain-containing protein n=1 Tax=Clostridium sp. MB40-C1 TaxID=3070996 RepID=UPI0027E07EDC|nr:PH domain-containing protein [Clostridium sp. MB40-C1]WMJ79351.1 PH domain-containing protein [Clostridium sp. MB40-C1]
MQKNKLNQNAKKSWLLARAIATSIVTAILVGIKWFFTYKIGVNFFIEKSFYINIFIILIIGLLILNTFIYPFIEYAQWKYTITKDKIEFSEGIYCVKTTIIPIIRVQHIKINQGPINKIFKLADIEIFTAGGSHKIPNLDMQKANEIGEYLKEKIKEKVEKNER